MSLAAVARPCFQNRKNGDTTRADLRQRLRAGNGNGNVRNEPRKGNGAGFSPEATEGDALEDAQWRPPEAPPVIADAAHLCIQQVERSLGVRLDYQPETLPLLDHYLQTSRPSVIDKPEIVTLLAQTAGAYFGEVIRRRYPSWWRVEGVDPAEYRIEFENVYLAVSPMRIIIAALLYGGDQPSPKDDTDDTDLAQLILDEDDREAVITRLSELPPVSEQEYYAPSTRMEVIDIVVDALRGRRMADGEGEQGELRLTQSDYD